MKYLVLLIGLCSSLANAQIVVTPTSAEVATPGDVITVKLRITDQTLVDTASPQKLQAASVPDALWFMSVSTWEMNAEGLTASARIVLGPKLIPSRPLEVSIDGTPVVLNLSELKFNPRADGSEDQLLYQEVPWYQRPWWKKHGLLSLLLASGLLMGGTIYGSRWRKRRQLEKRIKTQKQKLLSDLDAAKDLPTVSRIWLGRDEFETSFAEKKAELRSFFDVLNQVQFKPHFTQDDQKKVLEAKKKLVDVLRGETHGV